MSIPEPIHQAIINAIGLMRMLHRSKLSEDLEARCAEVERNLVSALALLEQCELSLRGQSPS